MSSYRLQDYIQDVSMDINQKFYPLPLINIPNVIIPVPRVTEYTFDNERKAIAEYERERTARGLARDEQPCSQPPSTASHQQVAKPLRKVGSAEGILEPTPAPFNNNSLRKAKTRVVDSLEEFEAKPSLYDLLEMTTIDDKAALEEVLLASAPCERRDSTINNVKL